MPKSQHIKQRWRSAIATLLLLLASLVMAGLMLARMRFIDARFARALECEGCYHADILLHDWPLAALAISLLLAGFALRTAWLSLPLRLAGLLVILLYATDYLTSTELSSRLVFHELPNYLADTGIIGRHLHNTGFLTGSLLLAALPATAILALLLFWPAYPRRSRALLLAGLLLASGLLAQAWSKTAYVHSWIFHNLFQYNWQRGEMRNYSQATIARTLAEPPPAPQCHPGLQQRHDIIILVLESWSVYQSRYFGGLHNWTPRLDSLATQGQSYHNFHAAGFSTNEGLMSLLTSMEVLATGQRRTPFITAWGNDYSLPAVMRTNGYHTSFLTSGHLGFSGKDRWLQHLGFDHIEGHDHPAYTGKPRYHFAAVADEHLYTRALEHLDQLQQSPNRKPYTVVIENVSSHHPYKHPHTGSTGQADVFGYMDSTAADFIRALQHTGYFNHGRLLVVSDHRAMIPVDPKEQHSLGLAARSRIPAFWMGQGITPGRNTQPWHQADVLPTLERWSAPTQCHPHGLRDMTDPHSTPRCVYHVRGDQREEINLFCPQGQGTILLAGDRTRIRSQQGLASGQQQQAVDWINRYRIHRDHHHQQWLNSQ